MRTIEPRTKTDLIPTVTDVLVTADRVGASTEVVVATLRQHMKLPIVAITHAVGVDATEYCGIGQRRSYVNEAQTLWDMVVATPLEVIVPEPDVGWEHDAACANHDNPGLWFCDDENCEAETEAIQTCVTCPAIGHCALYGLYEQHGLWAGLTTRGRRDLRRHLLVGVVPATPAAVGPLAADMAVSALKVRTAARNAHRPVGTPDGRLFDYPAVTSLRSHRRRTRNRVALPEPLFLVA